MKYILFVFFSTAIYSQKLHHQMISSQGNSNNLDGGFIIKQTIGQQSVIGTFSGKANVFQGYLNSNWFYYRLKSNPIQISTYPNPFKEIINFRVKESTEKEIFLEIFDVNGKKIIHLLSKNNLISLNLATLVKGYYFVKLSGNDFIYHTKIIKN